MANKKQKNKKYNYTKSSSYNKKQNKNKSTQAEKPNFFYKDYTDRVDTSGENRWSMTFGLINGNFKNLLLLNIVFLLFFLPTISLILYRNFELSSLASNLPYTHNFWQGGYYPTTIGQLEALTIYVDRYIYLGLLILGVLAPLAISGGFYLLRNFVWTNGVFNAKDFFKGIKNSYLKILFYTLILVVIFVVCLYSIALSNYYYALNGGWYFILAKICAIIVMSLVMLIYLFACSFTVTYKLPIFKTIVYAFKFSFNFFLPNVFFLALSVLPFIVIMFTGFSGIINMVISGIVIFAGFIFAFLVWSSYSQYVFDKVIEGKIDTTEKVKERKNKKDAKKNTSEERDTQYIKPVNDGVEIEQLPEMFSRKDIEKLRESKEHMKEDSDKYYNERKNKKDDGDSNE